MTIRCPKCNADNPDTQKFCGECGTHLRAAKDTSITKTLQKPLASPGKVIAGKYKILTELGRGGMGIVYKAEDTRLKRTVALKFLPAELTKDEEAKKRFIQEAQAAAALEHPNICTVYEVDEADDQTFIAMGYIEGKSLKDKLESGPLDIEKAKDIVIQVAEGLKEAHKKGIVHRDIKPANIMINDEGHAKITDFGLAKLSWGIDLTKPSTIMGTVAYMSPEQARGEAVDHRTDIWSFGAMLYEMLSGERPFKSQYDQAVFYSILNEKPEPITSICQNVPRTIEQLIQKTLEKNPAHRYQSMEEVLENLRTAQSDPGISTEPKKSIIVLPFENISPDPEQEYFCDGMTEEIITDLSHIHELLVISRNSAMTFKGTKKKTREIARETNVRYVLEGSVRKAGNNLRITAQLIDAETDAHLWAKRYSGTLDDVFDIQEKVSRSIAGALKLKLTSDENNRIASNPIPNIYAYECFLKARHELWKWTEIGLNNALGYLEKGLEIEGENAVLLAGMGYVYFQFSNTGIRTDEITLQKAENYTKRALEADPESPNAHIVLALLRGWRGNPQEAVRHFKRALGVEPNNFDGLVWLPCFCAYLGKTESTKPYVERLLRVEPHHPLTHFTDGLVNIMDGKFSPALRTLRICYESYPKDYLIQWIYAQVLLYSHLYDQADSVIEKMIKNDPDFVMGKLVYSTALGLNKKKLEGLSILKDPKIKALASCDMGASYYLAESYTVLDQKKEALDWLEHAIDLGFMNFTFLNETNPLLENIRSEPRFKKLMERVKHEWENFEV